MAFPGAEISPAAPTALPPSGPSGGDLTGTYPNPTINTPVPHNLGVKSPATGQSYATLYATGGIDFASSATPALQVIAGQNATAGSGVDGADLQIEGGAPDSGFKIGRLVIGSTFAGKVKNYGAPPNNLDRNFAIHVLNTATPNTFNLPPLDGSIPVDGDVFWIIYRGADGAHHAQISAAAGDSIGGPGLTVFAMAGAARPVPIMVVADLTNRTWWVYSGS